MAIHTNDEQRQRTFGMTVLRWFADEANQALDRRTQALRQARRIADAYGLPALELDEGGRAVIASSELDSKRNM